MIALFGAKGLYGGIVLRLALVDFSIGDMCEAREPLHSFLYFLVSDKFDAAGIPLDDRSGRTHRVPHYNKSELSVLLPNAGFAISQFLLVSIFSGSRHSSAGIVAPYTPTDTVLDSRQRQEVLVSSEMSIQAVGPTQPPINGHWVLYLRA
jgi:hypothetical protein